jgi:DNA-binding response OmpR family regulator
LNHQAPAIVLIEDNEVTLDLYRRELSKSFTVFACPEISGVLDILAKQDIQAVVIEPEIHSGQGWDLIDSIATAFSDRRIPIIVCSTRDASVTGPGCDVAKYLTKPVLPNVLREKTLDVLGLKEPPRKHS